MALSQQEFEKLTALIKEKQNPNLSGLSGVSQEGGESYLSRVGGQFSKSAERIKEGVSSASNLMAEGDIQGGVSRAALRTVGGVAGAAFAPITEAPVVKQGIEAVGGAVTQIPGFDVVATKLNEFATKYPEASKDVRDIIDIVGLGAGKAVEKPVASAISTAANRTAQATADVVGSVAKPVKDIASGLVSKAESVGTFIKDIPERTAVNLAEEQAKNTAIKSLGSPTVQKAAREGIEVNDLVSIKSIPKAERAPLKKLADNVKAFADGKTKTSPFEVVGKPIVSRLKIIDGQVKGYAKKLDDIAKGLEGQAVKDVETIKQSVNQGLENLKVVVDFDGKLNFVGSNLEGLGKSGNIVENVFKRIYSAKDASDLHRLKKFIDENVSYGKRVEGLSGEAERLLKSWRKSIDDTLDKQFPEYNRVNTELAKRIQPLEDLKGLLKNADGLDADLLAEKAGILARRITSAAPSNPEIKQVLRNLDKFTKSKGKTLLSVERLQDFYNILNKYYDIAPKTGFQNLTKEGVISGGETLTGIAVDVAKGLAGKSLAVRRKAFEDALAELLK